MAAKGAGTNGVTLSVVLLGKTGAGKSSLGNALTGKRPPKTSPEDARDNKPPAGHKDREEGFKVGRGLKSKTLYCDWVEVERFGVNVKVTDTPGLCDTEMREKDIYKEVAKSVALTEPGPNVIIFALRCDRFTKEEYDVYQKIKQLFSEEMSKFLIIVFTRLDTYDDVDSIEEQRRQLGEDVSNFGDKLDEMISEAGKRYFGINNKVSPPKVEEQIKDLVRMMLELVESNGKDVVFKTEMTEVINKNVEELVEEEARAKGVSEEQAKADFNRNLVSENVKPGFIDSLMQPVYTFAVKVKDGVTSMCKTM